MPYAFLKSATLEGIEALPVSAEVSTEFGKPYFNVVGLPDNVIKESKERILSAVQRILGKPLLRKIIVNLAPAELRKQGSFFDLPIALAIFETLNLISLDNFREDLFLGELSLAGELRPCAGVLAVAILARKQGIKRLFVPSQNAAEALLIEDLEVYKVDSLEQILAFFQGQENLERQSTNSYDIIDSEEYASDFADVKGQETAKRALEIAASGKHNALFSGAPGSGKSMLMKRFPSILPKMSKEEIIEVTKIYSAAGLNSNSSLITLRPFRSPHHTTSNVGLIGGGTVPKPGEITLAHCGVLFLDELPEFPRTTLELLRQPLEDKEVLISRAKISLKFPTNFIFLSTMNPCPCGYYGDPKKPCRCSLGAIRSYRGRISGPLLDRIDLLIQMPRLSFKEIHAGQKPESSEKIRERVTRAREVQFRRFSGHKSNGEMSHKEVEQFCKLGPEEFAFLEKAIEKKNFSNRVHDRILKICRTIADLENADRIRIPHIAEAINYRFLDTASP